MNNVVAATSPGGEVVVYEAPDGEVRVDVRFDRETVWLTQQQMAELFGRDRSVVNRHIRNAFREGELDPEATSAKFAQVQSEGGRTAFALLIAESAPAGKDLMIRLIINLLAEPVG